MRQYRFNAKLQEPNNLRGQNSFRFNGVIRKRTVGVEPAKDGKGVVLVTKRANGQKNPAKIYSRVELKRDPRRTFNAIRKITKCGGYRKDLSTAAIRRAAAIIKSQRPVVPKKTGRPKKE
ncbi:hypothetical protein C0Q70_17735 [Pomacea canaliculata]|uniref:Large ribosomal subunit protein eL28 n=1 Tax=Pomacea canaliculata TaxID=400727 RepID=A0A2T7NL88_POMCA|nr:hypothetical protein C0Q70_17735 [Pomacea canaliculata]